MPQVQLRQTDHISYGFQIQRRFHGLSFPSVPNDACSFSQREILSGYTLFLWLGRAFVECSLGK